MANLEVADETAERVLGHSLGGLMATYNVSRHRKQKMAALVLLETEIPRIVENTVQRRQKRPPASAGIIALPAPTAANGPFSGT